MRPRFRRTRRGTFGIRRRGLKRRYGGRGKSSRGLAIRSNMRRPIPRNKFVSFFAEDELSAVRPAALAGQQSSCVTGTNRSVLKCTDWAVNVGTPSALWISDPDVQNFRKFYSQNVSDIRNCSTGPLLTQMPLYYKHYTITTTRFTLLWNQNFVQKSDFSAYQCRSGLLYAFIWFYTDSDIISLSTTDFNKLLNPEHLKRQRYAKLRPIQMNPANFVPGKLSMKISHPKLLGDYNYWKLNGTFNTAAPNTYYTNVPRFSNSVANTPPDIYMAWGFMTSDGTNWGIDQAGTSYSTLINCRFRVTQGFKFSESHASDELMPNITSDTSAVPVP